MPSPSNGPVPSPANDRSRRAQDNPVGKPHFPPQRWWALFVVLLATNYLAMRLFYPEPSSITISYTYFKQQVAAGNVQHVTSVGEQIRGSFITEVSYSPESNQAPSAHTAGLPVNAPSSQQSMRFATRRPLFADPGLERMLEEKGVIIEAVDEGRPSWFTLLVGFGPTLLLIGAFVWLSQRAAAAGGGLFNLGRSRAKRYSEDSLKVTFGDVAGIDEAENELIEIVDFLKNLPSTSGLAVPSRRVCC